MLLESNNYLASSCKFTWWFAPNPINNHGEQDDKSDDQNLKKRRYSRHVQSVRHDAEDQNAVKCLQHFPRSARQRNAANDRQQ